MVSISKTLGYLSITLPCPYLTNLGKKRVLIDFILKNKNGEKLMKEEEVRVIWNKIIELLKCYRTLYISGFFSKLIVEFLF